MDQPLPPMLGNLPNGMGGGPGGPPPGGAGPAGDQFPPPPPTSNGGDFPPLGDLPPPTSQPSAQPPSASPDFQSNSGKKNGYKNVYCFFFHMVWTQLFFFSLKNSGLFYKNSFKSKAS